jgi:hypothetical protein
MKISELLEAIEPKKSNLPSAPSINDEPEDDVEDNDVEDNSKVNDYMNLASSMGNDMYSLSQWNYSDEFNNIGPDTSVLSVIESLSDIPEVANYISASEEYAVARDKRVCALIYVKSTNTFISFTADRERVIMSPRVNELASDSLVDSGQVSVLQMVMNTGMKYTRIASKSGDFDVGQSSGNSNFVPMLEALADGALKLPSVNTSAKVSSGDASVKFSLSDDDFEAKVRARMAEKKAKKDAVLKANKG